MFRKRERFERSDVPRETPYTNVIGVVVLVVVFVALAMTVMAVWNRVTLESRLGANDLTDSLSAQAKASAADGYVASSDELESTLFLTVSSAAADAGGTQLSDARILTVNKTQGTAVLATVPVSAEVASGETVTTLADLCPQSGADACVASLSAAAGVRFKHVVVATGDVLEKAVQIVGASKVNLVGEASDLLGLMHTDMDASDLLAFAETVSGVGLGNIQRTEASLVADPDQAEAGLQAIDKTALCLTLGTIVAAS